MRNLATLVMEREVNRAVEADSSLKLESSRPKATTRRLGKGGNGINVRAVLMDTETSQRKRDGEMVMYMGEKGLSYMVEGCRGRQETRQL